MSVNRVILVGRLGSTPELTHTKGGKPLVKFSIATARQFTKEDITDWHNITAWGSIADIIVAHCKRGQEIYIEGRIEYNKVGNKIYTNITADNFRFLGKKEQGGEAPAKEEPTSITDDESLPF